MAQENSFYNDFRSHSVDPRISYPSFRSMDEFVDIDALKALDSDLTRYVEEQIQKESGSFFLNLYRLEEDSLYKPGVREVWLTTTGDERPGYLDMVDAVDLWEPTPAADELPELMKFIATLPFEMTGRMIIIYDNSGTAVPPHRDHLDPEACNEFIWFRTNLRKPFYLLEPTTDEKVYVDSYTCWFDAVNQYHGCDGVDGLSISMRVDGIFSGEFRQKIPRPPFNAASTPSFWASMEAEAVRT